MAHVEDRWWKSVKDPESKKTTRVKTDLHGKGMRYRVRFLDPNGDERSRSFPDRCKRQADDFLIEVESTKREGKYVDPRAGQIKFRKQAESWIKGQSSDAATRVILHSRLDSQIYPVFGDLSVSAVKPSTVRDWLGRLDDLKLSENYKAVLFTVLSSVLDSAVEDKLITVNPCKTKSIKKPIGVSPEIVVWPTERLSKVRGGLAPRFKIICPLGGGCGLRQGEILGVSPDDVDRAAQLLHVRRQIRTVRGTLVFAPPKGGKIRRVPLSSSVLGDIDRHEQDFPAVEITLPWREPGGEPVTVRLLVAGEGGRLYSGDLFHKVVWLGGFREAGLEYRKRADGMHALRHFFASLLLSQGVSIKELAEYLGHSDPGFTLRTYTHLMPSSFERARLAVDGVFGLWATDGLEAA
ncbi:MULTISPECIES: tyrosine-type recombinase/integrase [unclassified Crossiella]|uniref:tyrosine-type recombinase/integrase n=1 Tax=unclassified Crossiella TaxID=2620835 RepID=UPI001FFF84EF|nr:MULTISPECIES: tyrosine-type recombinase/integrase [unclassified Crossiella]MCK2238396.1 site-specific integrase [Crossiella sp. S99.2]MCK2256436.1 site-specific integrase [Crossiella sp. S99.1]